MFHVAAQMSAADKDAEIAMLRQQNSTLQARVKELETGTARLSVRLSGAPPRFRRWAGFQLPRCCSARRAPPSAPRPPAARDAPAALSFP